MTHQMLTHQTQHHPTQRLLSSTATAFQPFQVRLPLEIVPILHQGLRRFATSVPSEPVPVPAPSSNTSFCEHT